MVKNKKNLIDFQIRFILKKMSHNEKRTNWFKEGAIGLGVGVAFGVTVVAVGHVRTVKTLQLQILLNTFFLLNKAF